MFQEFFKYVNIENDDIIDSPEQFLKKYVLESEQLNDNSK